jgi:glutaminase
MNYSSIIETVYQQLIAEENKGELATYIPELAKVDPDSFAVHITSVDHQEFGIGDVHKRFSLQSISKVLTLSLAYSILGELLWERLGVEPSGTAFNSLSQLELDKGIPRNPFVNAGAIVVCDILITQLQHPKVDFLTFCRHLTGIETLDYSARTVESERKAGYRNIALCHFIKSFGNIINDPDEVLDFYFNICSLEMSCFELSKAFLFLATENFSTTSTERFLTASQAKRINAIMQTCGFYDESGEFAFRVGLPGKSGVGGGIMAIHPNKYCIAVLSPKLNPKGNSYRGMKFLELFTTETQLSIF